MNMLLQKRILTAVLVSLTLVLSLSGCGKKSAVQQLQEAIERSSKQLPQRVDAATTWTVARYDRAANEIVFEYSFLQNVSLQEDDLALMHQMMCGQIMTAFAGDGEEMVSLIRKVRPNVRYIFRWAGDGHILIDDTCRPEEYL